MKADAPEFRDADGGSRGSSSDVVALALGELQRSPYREVRYIWCEWRDGVLTLRGQVSNFYLKQIAQSLILHRLEGIVTLNNQVEVVAANGAAIGTP
jgi:hypothetical protein